MDSKHKPLWAKYLIHAAIEYFTDRHEKACLILDNVILDDPVLAGLDDVSDDFVVCIAPGYTTQMDFGDTDLTIAVRFSDITHVMEIPYGAIKAVKIAQLDTILSDEGHLNIITIPPVVYPPRSKFRNDELMADKVKIAMESSLEIQPTQRELSLVAHRGR